MYKEPNVEDFLAESNAIEDIFDEQSLMDAKKAWDHLMQWEQITISCILETHALLMKNQPIPEAFKGGIRTVNVQVGGRVCPAPASVPYLLSDWIHHANNDKTGDEIKRSHIRYEEIHPFIDGNGRTGRMFMNYQRLKIGLPILVIRHRFRDNYYQWFERL